MKLNTLAVGLLVCASAMLADTPGRHPAYLHARSDLWRAMQIMQTPDERNVRRDLGRAMDETREAIGEIDRAAAMDRKFLDERPPVDTNLRGKPKFRAIAQLLWSAKKDIAREEDNPGARGWRNRAIQDIDHGLELVRNAAYDDHIDDEFRGRW